MAHTYEELKKMTVAELKAVAKDIENEAVKGYTQLNKEHLLKAICSALGLDTTVHHEVQGVNKSGIKAQIRELKKDRDKAIEAHDSKKLKEVRQQIKKLKKRLRRATL